MSLLNILSSLILKGRDKILLYVQVSMIIKTWMIDLIQSLIQIWKQKFWEIFWMTQEVL